MKTQGDAFEVQVLQQRIEIVNVLREPVGVGLRFVGKAAAHMIGGDHAICLAEFCDEASIVEGPGWIPVQHDEGISRSFVQVVVL